MMEMGDSENDMTAEDLQLLQRFFEVDWNDPNHYFNSWMKYLNLDEGSDPDSPLQAAPPLAPTAKAKAEDENTEEAFWAELDEGSDPKPSSPLLEGWPGLVTPPESPAPGPGPIGPPPGPGVRDLSHIWGPRSPSWALIPSSRCCPQFPPAAPGPGDLDDWHWVDQLDDSSDPSSAGLPPGPHNWTMKSDNEIIEIISTLPGNLKKCVCVSLRGESAKCAHCSRPCASTRPTRPPALALAPAAAGLPGLPPQSQPAEDDNTEEAFWAELDEVTARKNIDDEKPQFMSWGADICEELYYDIEELIARGPEAQADAETELQYEVLFAAI